MGYFLLFAFLFMLGCSFGWVLEVFYRRFISSSNPERRWINPGFLTGPALPLYGTGVCAMWLIVSLEPFPLRMSPSAGRCCFWESLWA